MNKFTLGLTVGTFIGGLIVLLVFTFTSKEPETVIVFEANLGQEEIEFKTFNPKGPVAEFTFFMSAENYGVSPSIEYQKRKFKLSDDEREPVGSMTYNGTTILIKDGFPVIKEKEEGVTKK